MSERYKSIGLKESQYEAISDKKRVFESTIGRHFDWGTFLLILAGLQPAGVDGGEKVAELHDSEGEEANVEDYEELPGLPITLAEEDQERIAELVATKVLERLKER